LSGTGSQSLQNTGGFSTGFAGAFSYSTAYLSTVANKIIVSSVNFGFPVVTSDFGGANFVGWGDGANTINIAANDSTWISLTTTSGTGASLAMNVNGSTNTGPAGAAYPGTNQPQLMASLSANFLTGKWVEWGIWPSSQYASNTLCHNQQGYWGGTNWGSGGTPTC
jgi:hypothetical protein